MSQKHTEILAGKLSVPRLHSAPIPSSLYTVSDKPVTGEFSEKIRVIQHQSLYFFYCFFLFVKSSLECATEIINLIDRAVGRNIETRIENDR